MSIFSSIHQLLSRSTVDGPTFVKDFSKDNVLLEQLNNLLGSAPEGKAELIERDIRSLKYGIEGESNVYFELKNSFLPFLCLHDLRIEYDDYVAQLDFVLLTKSFICVLETKRLSGNITVNSKGEFIRTIKGKGGKEFKEGVYSPITQNERHLAVLNHLFQKEFKKFDLPIISLVVMANPKTVISRHNCPPDIDKHLVKHDQLANKLRSLYKDGSFKRSFSDKKLYELTDLLLKYHKPIEIDLLAKYAIGVEESPRKSADTLREELTAYRLKISRELNIKAYYIFNNNQMEELIRLYPQSPEDLIKLKGFGPTKVDTYGQEILKIFGVER